MEPKTNKRKRSANWDAAEKDLLRNKIKEEIHYLENKCTDTNTNKKKRLAWLRVHKRFSELDYKNHRTLMELKQQWRQMKREAKINFSYHMKTTNETEGQEGSKSPSPDPTDSEPISMLSLQFEPDTNEFDSNSTQNPCQVGETDNNDEQNNEAHEITKPNETESSPLNKSDLFKIPQDNLSSFPRRERAKSTNSKNSVLDSANERNLVVTECIRSENALRLQQMMEAHEWARKEHILKMENLKLKKEFLTRQLKEL